MPLYSNIKAIRKVQVDVRGIRTVGRQGAFTFELYHESTKSGFAFISKDSDRAQMLISSWNACKLRDVLAEHCYALEAPYSSIQGDSLDWLCQASHQLHLDVLAMRKLKRLSKRFTILRLEGSTDELDFYRALPTPRMRDRLREELGDRIIEFMNDEINGL